MFATVKDPTEDKTVPAEIFFSVHRFKICNFKSWWGKSRVWCVFNLESVCQNKLKFTENMRSRSVWTLNYFDLSKDSSDR